MFRSIPVRGKMVVLGTIGPFILIAVGVPAGAAGARYLTAPVLVWLKLEEKVTPS